MWLKGNVISESLAKIRQYGLEYSHRRFYSKYKGSVAANADPQQQGRIKVTCPDTGNVVIDTKNNVVKPATLELFAYPTSPFVGDNYGFYFPPEVGSPAYVWFDHGDPTQPNYSGGWWTNPGGEAATTLADTSTIPVEFNAVLNARLGNNNATVDSREPTPTTRGIKSALGHGILFEDDPASGSNRVGRETRVELWSGQNIPNFNGTPRPAEKHHQIVLSDTFKKIRFKSYRGHVTEYDDNPASQGINSTTTYGHVFKMNDVLREIQLKTTLGHELLASDTGNSMQMKTVAGHILLMSDPALSITLKTPANQNVTLNDTSQTILVQTLGTTLVDTSILLAKASAGALMTAGTSFFIGAGGILTMTAQGISITSQGTAPCFTVAGGVSTNTFTGLVTENYNGGVIQNVNGVWQMVPTVGLITSPNIQLGTGTKFVLVDARFLNYYNNHTHASPGAPPVVQFGPGGGQLPTNLVATTNTKAS